jgi:transmembrane sensor
MERECLAWQGRSAAHRLAFERCTDTWQDVGRLTHSSYTAATGAAEGRARAEKTTRTPRATRWPLALGIALVASTTGGLAVLQPWRHVDTYSTGVGEQRAVLLADGTRMSLNTATRVKVQLGSAQRTVRLEGGEALFEVAKDAHRPFVVQAAGSEVVAVGTVFSVRMTPQEPRVGDALAVTLVEGRVTVRSAPDRPKEGASPAEPIQLQPGDRVRLGEVVASSSKGAPQVKTQMDRPRIEQVIAWKRDEAVFDDVSLADAVTEMNRYSRTPVVLVGDETLGRLRVSGLFRTGDVAGFARAVAALHALATIEREGRLELRAQ